MLNWLEPEGVEALVRPGLWFAVLGAVRVRRDGHEVDLGPPQQRTVLALLMASGGQPMSVSEIVDAMWGAEPPATAVNAVHRCVGALRRALEPELPTRQAGQWLVPSAGGYRLDVDADSLDLLRFRHLLDQARTAASGSGATAFVEALELWRGRCAAGIDIEVRGHPLFTALDREYVTSAQAAADAAISAGEAALVLAPVRRAAEWFPLDEPVQARLVRLLAEAGHQAEALEAFQRVRDRLVEELGLDPGPQLTAARDHVLGLATPLDERTSADPPPTRVTPAELPADLSTFVGRRAELSHVLALFDGQVSPSTLVISAIGGMAGIGKTTLAVHWAHQVAHRFPDGQLYLNLRGFDPSDRVLSPIDALRGLLTGLGVPAAGLPTELDALAALYRSHVAGRRLLIVADNARDAEQVRPLLPGSAGCLVIVTSRNQLGGLVAVDGAHALTLDVLSADEARDFLSRRLGAAVIAADPAAVDDIVALCAGLPLALAIVAARAAGRPTFPLSAVVADLREAHGTLDGFAGPDAAIDARAVFSWSYRSLTPAAARLFRLLGAHPGPDLTSAAAASLAAMSGREVRPPLAELAQARLLVEHAPGRYSSHDLLYAYARELAAADPDERNAALHRVLDHYLAIAFSAERLFNPDRLSITLPPRSAGVNPEVLESEADALVWMSANERVLLTAVREAVTHGFDQHVWQLVWAMSGHLLFRMPPETTLAMQHLAVEATDRIGDRVSHARNLNGLAHAYGYFGRFDEAHPYFVEALATFTELGDRYGQARIGEDIAYGLNLVGRHDEAADHSERSAELFREVGDRNGEARCLGGVAWSHARLGHYQQALDYGHAAIELARDLTGAEVTGDHHTLGYAYHKLGDHLRAVAWFEEAIDGYRRIGDYNHVAVTLNHLSDAQSALGDEAAAATTLRLAITTLVDPDFVEADELRAKIETGRGPETGA